MLGERGRFDGHGARACQVMTGAGFGARAYVCGVAQFSRRGVVCVCPKRPCGF
jgi:hypothetical protein